MKFAFLLSFALLAPAMAMPDFKAHITVNGKTEFKATPGAPTSIELYFTDPHTQEVYKEFKVMHGKIMHMVLMKKDLSEFRHIHPYFDPVTGRFHITLNLPYSDPDNQDAVAALTEPGSCEEQ